MTTRIFAEGSYAEGTLTWGWVCDECGEEGLGFTTASWAADVAGHHQFFCAVPTSSEPGLPSGSAARDDEECRGRPRLIT